MALITPSYEDPALQSIDCRKKVIGKSAGKLNIHVIFTTFQDVLAATKPTNERVLEEPVRSYYSSLASLHDFR